MWTKESFKIESETAFHASRLPVPSTEGSSTRSHSTMVGKITKYDKESIIMQLEVVIRNALPRVMAEAISTGSKCAK